MYPREAILEKLVLTKHHILRFPSKMFRLRKFIKFTLRNSEALDVCGLKSSILKLSAVCIVDFEELTFTEFWYISLPLYVIYV